MQRAKTPKPGNLETPKSSHELAAFAKTPKPFTRLQTPDRLSEVPSNWVQQCACLLAITGAATRDMGCDAFGNRPLAASVGFTVQAVESVICSWSEQQT